MIRHSVPIQCVQEGQVDEESNPVYSPGVMLKTMNPPLIYQ